jgi:DNA-directed RNA polymerase subunit RPC12/RpoP
MDGIPMIFTYKCPACKKKQQLELNIDSGPEQGSYDYPGSGAEFSNENGNDEITCTECGDVMEWGEFESQFDRDVQEQIAEYMADKAGDYYED